MKTYSNKNSIVPILKKILIRYVQVGFIWNGIPRINSDVYTFLWNSIAPQSLPKAWHQLIFQNVISNIWNQRKGDGCTKTFSIMVAFLWNAIAPLSLPKACHQLIFQKVISNIWNLWKRTLQRGMGAHKLFLS